MLITWVVIYQTNLGEIFGWFCKAPSPSAAERKFWDTSITPLGRTIKCVCELQSNVIDAYFSLYGGEAYGQA